MVLSSALKYLELGLLITCTTVQKKITHSPSPLSFSLSFPFFLSSFFGGRGELPTPLDENPGDNVTPILTWPLPLLSIIMGMHLCMYF